MNRRLSLAVPLVVIALMLLSPEGARAQTTAVGPYYAMPAWDQTLACSSATNCPRFIVLSNFGGEAVLDRETGLVWDRAPSTATFTLISATIHCHTLTAGGRMGWRMPQTEELYSLLDPSQLSNLAGAPAALPAGHPFTDVQPSSYWVRDQAPPPFNNGTAVISVFLATGTFNTGSLTDSRRVWCVRSGHGAQW